jgi:hypothetical protein
MISTYLKNKILDHILKVASYTPPTHIYIALSTADPLADGSGLAEPSGGSYARVICDDWTLAALRRTRNADELNFVKSTGAWGLMTHYAVMDALTDGNMLACGALADSRSCVTGNDFSIKAGDIEVDINTGDMSNYLANAILDHVFINTVYTPPAHIYVAGATETIYDSSTGTTIVEPDDSAYAREQFDTWNTASAGASSNDGDIDFDNATESQGIITDVALVDALTVGNLLIYGKLTTAQEINAGGNLEFADESLDIVMA